MWTAKLFDVLNPQQTTQRFALTMRSDKFQWAASDPKGMIDPDAGNWQSGPSKTVFFDKSASVFELTDLAPDKVTKGEKGAGFISASKEIVEWHCTDVIS